MPRMKFTRNLVLCLEPDFDLDEIPQDELEKVLVAKGWKPPSSVKDDKEKRCCIE